MIPQTIAMFATVRLRSLLLCVFLLNKIAGAFPPLTSDCDLVCSTEDENSGPVCGNDGRTYESRCEVERSRCQGLPIQVKHDGKCTTERARCAAQRALALAQGEERGLFVPECHEDGSYAEVQCHLSTGYCWCVDRQGKPIRGSSIHNARPTCAAHQGKGGRKSNRRRSSRGRKNKKGCGTNDRASFNANLIDIFQSEYDRVDHSNDETEETGTSDPLRDTHEKRVIQWKFDQLDSNGDSALHRSEVRDLRRMARRIVRPRGCARTFAKFCDLDQDRRISRAEWAVCVGVDINNEQVGRLEDFLDDQPKLSGNTEDPTSSRLNPEPWDRESHVPRLYQITPETSNEEKEVPKEEEPQDCTSARINALEIDRQAPGANTYIPECTLNGDYTRVQCHRSPSYCWCVHPRTGRPIKGTATLGVKPDCDSAKAKTKNIKGCSLHKKQEFLDELIKSFSKEMQEDAQNKSLNIDPPTPEKAARWKFASADTNSNSVLDKREWKIFKTEWRTLQKDSRLKRRLRKCWRNLPRFCDENTDQKITMDEWLACTVTTRDSKSNLPITHRRGKNPLTTYLKSD